MNLRTLTISEAHAATGIPKPRLRRLFEDGAVAGNRTGNRIRLSEASLAAFINQTVTVSRPADGRAFPEVEDQFS